MLDATLRNLTEMPRVAALARLGGSGDRIMAAASFAFGIGAAAAIATGFDPAGLALLVASRLAATFRREPNATGRTLDYIAYASLPFAFALADPSRSLAALFVMLGLLAAGMTLPAAESRGVFGALARLTESAEIALAFALACLLPQLFSVVAYVLGTMCFVCAGARIADFGIGAGMKIVIIGGGVAGLGIGWRLVQTGAEVVVLERAQPGSGATWAAAGMLAVAGELGVSTTPEADFGRYARGLWPAFAAEVEAASNCVVGFEECGALLASMPDEGSAAFAGWPSAARLDPAKAREIAPMLTPSIAGARWAPEDAKVDARGLGQALARAFIGAGGTLRIAEAAIRFEIAQGGIRVVRTSLGLHEADAFVLAAGAWTSQIEGLPREAVPPVVPVKGQMIALAPPAGAVLAKPIVWGNGVYLVPRGKRLLVGATVEEVGFDTSLTRAAARDLQARATALMPALAQWEFADHWAGLRPGSPDGLPMLGPTVVEGLYAATGQFRNGILFAPAIAELLCRLVLERRAEPLAFDPRRFR